MWPRQLEVHIVAAIADKIVQIKFMICFQFSLFIGLTCCLEYTWIQNII